MAQAAPASATSTIGHALAALLGVNSLVDGVLALLHDMTGVLVATTWIVGALLVVLSWFSWHDRSRAAWSFIVSICSVFAVITLFGAPKMLHLGMPLVGVVIVPPLYITVVALLGTSGDVQVAGASKK